MTNYHVVKSVQHLHSMSHDTRNAGFSLLLAIALVAGVSASARFLYSDAQASAAQLEGAQVEQVACQ